MQLSSQSFPKETREELFRAGRAVAVYACLERLLDKYNRPFRLGAIAPASSNIISGPS